MVLFHFSYTGIEFTDVEYLHFIVAEIEIVFMPQKGEAFSNKQPGALHIAEQDGNNDVE